MYNEIVKIFYKCHKILIESTLLVLSLDLHFAFLLSSLKNIFMPIYYYYAGFYFLHCV